MRRRHSPAEVSLLRRWRKLDDAFCAEFGKGYRPISRKRHPLDCGQTGCVTCHSDKIHGHETTRQERVADMRLREGR